MAADHADDAAVCKNTIFVRNLPLATTNEQLEECFSQVGPVKQCFVIKDRGSSTCKGYGYVIYAIKDDASKAVQEIKSIGGRKVFLKFARRKFLGNAASNKKPVGGRKEDTTDADTEVIESTIKPTVKAKAESAAATPTEPGAHAVVGKHAKLIVRNLSFKCDESKLQKLFSTYGPVCEVTIPKKNDGKMKGFAFIKFKHKLHASKALADLNAKEILGRPVAVDWAVGRDTYLQAVGGNRDSASAMNSAAGITTPSENVTVNSKLPTVKSANGEVPAKPRSTGTSESIEKEPFSSKSNASNKKASKPCSAKENEPESSDEGEKDSESEESEQDAEKAKKEEEEEEEEEGEEEEEEETEGEDDDRDDDSHTSVTRPLGKQNIERNKDGGARSSSDVGQGRTVFIRNLSFLSAEDGVKELFEQFGDVNYAKVVYDAATGRPKGMAFVQFKNKAGAEKCLAAAAPGSDAEALTLDGRVLSVTLAVSRDEARGLVQKDKKSGKEGKDNRNLVLVREGMIRPGTKAAEGLSEADLRKRSKLESAKRQKLKNPNMFVSTTRLSVHNIPVNISDKELRQIFLKHAGSPEARIKECRIMRDLSNVNSQGVAKSRGYAFVEFAQHEHAVHALRQVNNSSEIFGPTRRPIVEFSIENKAVLELKQKRQERDKVKQAIHRGEAPPKKSGPAKSVKVVLPSDMNKASYAPKGLPKHWGPKIRHRPRDHGNAEKQTAKGGKRTQRPAGSRAEKRLRTATAEAAADHGTDVGGSRPKKQRKREKPEVKDSFDAMLSKYRQKLAGVLPAKRAKWFNS